MLKKIGFVFVLSFFWLICAAEEAKPSQAFTPPYPDVWGYDLSNYPAFKWADGNVDAYRMKDGDIWFIATINYEKEDLLKDIPSKLNKEYLLIKFFGREIKKINQKEVDQLSISKNWLYKSEIVNFRDGSTLKIGYNHVPKLCYTPDFLQVHFIKTEPNHNETKYSFLAATPGIKVWKDKGLCEMKGAPFFYQKLYALDHLIDLKDDTFIVYSYDSDVILRYDKNFHTQFKPVTAITTNHGNIIPRNFFVIEYSLIEELDKKVMQEEVPYNQAIHDKLLMALQQKYK